jgi:Ca2+-binding RTX toxin-like protein
MFDNLTVANGKVVVQEDPGGNDYVARVWEYDIATGGFHELAGFDPEHFAPGGSQFITNDEESSGVINITDVIGYQNGEAYLLDAQVHAPSAVPGVVEQGQLTVMYVDDPFLIGGNAGDKLFGSYANETLRGNNGDDSARAGSGNDIVYGGNGDDVLGGDAGNDQLFGDNGNDRLYGGAGDDTLTGGRGADQFVVDNKSDSGHDVITDFSQGDTLLLTQSIGTGTVNIGSSLALAGGGTLEINNGSSDVTALKSQGTINIGGTDYYVYSAAAASKGGALVSASSVLDMLHVQHVTHDHLI